MPEMNPGICQTIAKKYARKVPVFPCAGSACYVWCGLALKYRYKSKCRQTRSAYLILLDVIVFLDLLISGRESQPED